MSRPFGTAAELERRRRRAVQAVDRGESPEGVASIYGVNRASMYRWLKMARQIDGLAAKPHPGRAPRLSSEQLQRLISVEHKANALSNMCFVARHVVGYGDTVIGIGFSPYEGGVNALLAYSYQPDWTPELAHQAAEFQKRTGLFTATLQKFDCYEYPPKNNQCAVSSISDP